MKLLTESGILTVVGGEPHPRHGGEHLQPEQKRPGDRRRRHGGADGAAGPQPPLPDIFSGGGADPRRDMLLMTTCTLTLTDEEFTGFLTEINQTALKYMDIGVKEGSRQRQITLISSPTDRPGSR